MLDAYMLHKKDMAGPHLFYKLILVLVANMIHYVVCIHV